MFILLPVKLVKLTNLDADRSPDPEFIFATRLYVKITLGAADHYTENAIDKGVKTC